MLAYLAVQGPTARRDLRLLLWPNSQRPDASLRVALHLLKKEDGGAVEGIDLLRSDVICDANVLLGLHGQEALDAYPGPFLPDVQAFNVSVEFEEWVDLQRARVARHVQNEALALAERTMPEAAALAAERAYRLSGAVPPDPDLLRRMLEVTLPGSAFEREVRSELEPFIVGATPVSQVRAAGRMLGRETELDALLAWSAGRKRMNVPGSRS